jgi:hypothetical protein
MEITTFVKTIDSLPGIARRSAEHRSAPREKAQRSTE